MRTFPIANCPEWTYATKLHHGTLAVDGRTLAMRFRIALAEPTSVPDVLEVEAACKGMATKPNTLEGYTAILAKLVGATVTGKGKTATHGVITCTFRDPPARCV